MVLQTLSSATGNRMPGHITKCPLGGDMLSYFLSSRSKLENDFEQRCSHLIIKNSVIPDKNGLALVFL